MSQAHALTSHSTSAETLPKTTKSTNIDAAAAVGTSPASALGRQAQTPVEPGFLPLSAAQAADPDNVSGGIADDAAAWLNSRYGNWPAERVIAKAVHGLFEDRIAAVSSFGAESAVLLALIARVAPDLPLIFLDTGQHFPETLAYRDELVAHLGLTGLRVIQPDPVQLEHADRDATLWSRAPDYCCHLRKVLPLENALEGFSAWIGGRKRHHGETREGVRVFEALEGRIQINPLAHWSADDINRAFRDLGLPRHPLVADGLLSIGCAPCTQPAGACAGPRSGRWAGSGKTECGIYRQRGETSAVPRGPVYTSGTNY